MINQKNTPKLTYTELTALKDKLTGYNAGAPKLRYGQWVGVEIECFLDTDKLPSHLYNSGRDNCHGDHECDCELDTYRAEWFNEEYSAYDVLNMSDRERSRAEDRMMESVYCEENHCDCSEEHEADHRAINSYFKQKGFKNITCESDGSLNRDDFNSNMIPIEFQVNFEVNNPKPLKYLLDKLNEWGAKVNTTCGLHVHFDKRKKTVLNDSCVMTECNSRRLLNDHEHVRNWFSENSLIYLMESIVPKSRRDNRYCDLRVSESKYSYVHLLSETIEYRFFNGSVDYDKIISVISFLNEITKACASNKPIKPENFSEKTLAWIVTRQSKFCDLNREYERLVSIMDDCTIAFNARITNLFNQSMANANASNAAGLTATA